MGDLPKPVSGKKTCHRFIVCCSVFDKEHTPRAQGHDSKLNNIGHHR